jgi:hypothetical protein
MPDLLPRPPCPNPVQAELVEAHQLRCGLPAALPVAHERWSFDRLRMSGLFGIWFSTPKPSSCLYHPNPAQAELVEAHQRPCGLPATLAVARQLADQIPITGYQCFLLSAAPAFEFAFGGKRFITGQEAI